MAFNKSKRKGEITRAIESKEREDKGASNNMKFSLQDFDSSQKYGSGFSDWQSDKLLSHAMDLMRGYSKRPWIQQVDGDKFCVYGKWPEKTLFDCPKNLELDSNWARIHVNGKAVIVGHLLVDTFYIVFLDKSHAFWQTERDQRRK